MEEFKKQIQIKDLDKALETIPQKWLQIAEKIQDSDEKSQFINSVGENWALNKMIGQLKKKISLLFCEVSAIRSTKKGKLEMIAKHAPGKKEKKKKKK